MILPSVKKLLIIYLMSTTSDGNKKLASRISNVNIVRTMNDKAKKTIFYFIHGN